ncbi:alcohol dehydrogenase [Halobacteriales archaeon QS_8_65_32]|nr:MAG: alcohol dehydrogenase [Halobacteriales archaeon QS_8_65_32]
MEIEAAVVREESGPFEIESLELEEPQAGEVLVRIVGAGVCHTDIAVRDQYYPTPLPAVLGHEGSGVVEEVGEGVTKVDPGDRVVLTFDFDTTCPNCKRGQVAYCEDFFAHNFAGRRVTDGSSPIGRATNGSDADSAEHKSVDNGDGDEGTISGMFFGQSSFGTHAIATERNVVPVDEDVPLELLGPLGCGIQTGAGGVINTLDPQAGSSIVVFGTGSVGLSAVMAANLKGCTDVIAVDLKPARLAKARDLGATHAIDPEDVEDVGAAIREHLGGGAQYTVETTANPAVLREAVDVLRQTGTCGVIGAPPMGTEVSLDVNTVLFGRTVTGIIEGSSTPDLFIPDLIDLYRQGKFPFDEIVTYYDFDGIERAVSEHEAGETIKPILRMSEP